MDLADLRESYIQGTLRRDHLKNDPIKQFEDWFEHAQKANLHEPNAMVLCTIAESGMPSQRNVLLKGIRDAGFVFYTNYTSRKAQEIEEHPKVSLIFSWLELERQVIIQGIAKRGSREETKNYFQSRPRESQLGAWASKQSEAISNRDDLEKRFEKYEKRFEGKDIPVPDFWGGYIVQPLSVEFWQGGAGRMHDRLRFERSTIDAIWQVKRYCP